MGSGAWSASTYAATTGTRIASGTTFGYTRDTYSKPRSQWAAHEDLDPKKVAGEKSEFAGEIVREARDSAEHPNSLPISVFFDGTGSMGSVPRVLQKKLAGLFGLLLRKGYVEDPQVMFGCYGDAYVDQVPLQVAQFESDNRSDEHLDKLFIEGGGGGNDGETVTAAWYYMANHTYTDSFEKRGKKGYAFFIADEKPLPLLPSHITTLLGDEAGSEVGDLSIKGLADAISEKWEVFILLIDNFSAKMQGSEKVYKNLFGEKHVLIIENPDTIAETIALAVGAMEGTLDFDDAENDLKDVGSDALTIRTVVGAVAGLKDLSPGTVVKNAPDLGLGGGSAPRL